MLDYNLLRDKLEVIFEKLSRRNFLLDIKTFKCQEKNRKILQNKMEILQQKRNFLSKIIGKRKSCGKDVTKLYKEVKKINLDLKIKKSAFNILKTKIHDYMSLLPNIPDNTVPLGINYKNNVEILKWGIPKKFDFSIRDHVELGSIVNGLDFSSASNLTGSRFVVMCGKIAYMHRALVQFMLDVHIEKHGYYEYSVPYLVNHTTLYGSGQIPVLFNDLYHVNNVVEKKQINCRNIYALIPTGEVPLVNLMRNKIFNEEVLPIRIISHTPCFRSEAGSYGKDSRGLIRMHQFEKVEIVQMVHSKHSMQALEEITNHAEKILQLLNLPYRKTLLCSGDLSFTSCKTYDLEVWLPSKNDYCEISSCSNTSDFQARRIKSRYRTKHDKKLHFVHILNGSGLAVSRTLAAILENYQLINGDVNIPLVLQPYMKGLTHLSSC
ncbi:Serine--tRNA ligase [Candidatus Westeberhardia cardiocondylae]|uniref:Serine--tRNA ligase n=1 Tax=Candidatus Westeberhardia cardiocondylae TaxID=1594731 RepID=A0A0H5BWR5_9ENTR|nr:serine--tRNA ligase [Candidatus Westeberhardia cardiocondylae]CEN32160.1 Serine--tRNA ligase [Candidatus Westeberhardia cardiocondylae]